MAETIRNFTTKRECGDGDWKTQLAKAMQISQKDVLFSSISKEVIL